MVEVSSHATRANSFSSKDQSSCVQNEPSGCRIKMDAGFMLEAMGIRICCWEENKETRERYAAARRSVRTNDCSITTKSIFILYLFMNISVSFEIDMISTSQSLSGNNTLVSSSGYYELGFFTPGNSTNYYIGIWIKKIPVQTIVWVANRNTHISDMFSSELTIIDGNLVLLDESKNQIWSTNINFKTSNSTTAILLGDGNLVLRDMSNSVSPIWQSFDYPTDTILPGSKLGYNNGTKIKQVLTSWKSLEDPAPGLFTLELDIDVTVQLRIKRNITETYWISESWNGSSFGSLSMFSDVYILVSNENETYFAFSPTNASFVPRLIMDVSGQIMLLIYWPRGQQWVVYDNHPSQDCEVYGFCGAYGSCNIDAFPVCHCLSGFNPRSENDWNRSDFSGGCKRNFDLQCGNTGRAIGKNPEFLPSSQQIWPHPSQQVPVLTTGDCESMCLNNCSCSAYAYGHNAKTEIMDCWIWNGDVFNLQDSLKISSTKRTTYFKLASSDPRNSYKATLSRAFAGIISAIVIPVVLLFCFIGYVLYRRTVKRREQKERTARLARSLIDPQRLGEDDTKGIDVPFIELELILAATSDFALTNKLGQGGFGPVYKGNLPGGIEIAVKRLSSHSRQGLEEFKNEVVLIAKLQHRNLVRILGYCIKGDEKLLVYEYMPNKSLDSFIFGDTLQMSLDWPKRFNIIIGITRGLLYLHQDSILRIIHRDLKASNILLDGDMNPKISDFGLARIVEGRDTEANTNRVVGTYGYMSPEYALDGHFSIKSDVFSFGIVVLEIISGKKNTGFYQHEEALSLLGYAWNMWTAGKPLDLMVETLVDSHDPNEVLKCIIVGLLCVQDDPSDRPTMSNVVSMLVTDIGNLPKPKEPAFLSRKRLPCLHSLGVEPIIHSNNELTMSVQEGR